jgi:GTP cyclohydrolase II
MSEPINFAVRKIGQHRITTKFGQFWLTGFEATNHDDRLVLALTPAQRYRGKAAPLIRVQLSCVYGEAFGSLDCDCALQLDASLTTLNSCGHGALVYFPNTDSRGLGLKTKILITEAEQSLHLSPFLTARASEIPYQDFDCLKYVPGVLQELHVEGPIRLLSNNPEKTARLTDAGLIIESMVPLIIDEQMLSALAKEEIVEKRALLGHLDASELVQKRRNSKGTDTPKN